MLTKKQKELVLKYCLQNAIFYSGKAETKAVMGKVLSAETDLRPKAMEVKEEIDSILKKINSMKPENQKKELEKLDPNLLVKEKKKKQEDLPELKGAKMGKVVTRFAPSPTGPLSLHQTLRALMLSYLYAQKYKGKFFVRIEDTDPKNIEKRYIKWIREDLVNLGVKFDKFILQSDRMKDYYLYAQKLIRKGLVYSCTCPSEEFKKQKSKKRDCPCRDKPHFKVLEDWVDAENGKVRPGQIVFRLKTSMKEPNPAIRDPAVFRIEWAKHPIQGKRYKIWPLYNFSCAIDDHALGITHVFRGKEHEHNSQIQKRIYKAFGWKAPITINFGMIVFGEGIYHTRDIKKMIREKKIKGWTDPRINTIRSLLRRGIHPDAIKRAALGAGLSKTDIRFSIENLESINRKVIDPLANRYMVVIDPQVLTLEKFPDIKEVKEPFHLDFPERGKKKIYVNIDCIMISKEDVKQFQNKKIRLKGLGNIQLKKTIGKYIGNDIVQSMPKIQWVSIPHTRVLLNIKGKKVTGFGDPSLNYTKIGDIIQMERVGFGRIVGKGNGSLNVLFAHK